MTHRDDYEKWQREKTEMAMDIRLKLVECFTEQADRARRERRWEAAAAYDYAAAVSLGYVAKIEMGVGPKEDGVPPHIFRKAP